MTALENAIKDLERILDSKCEATFGLTDSSFPHIAQVRVVFHELKAAFDLRDGMELTGSEWRPIETAPKDGTSVILLVDDKSIEGWFWEKLDRWEFVTLNSHGCGCCYSDDPPPTHWMPLPKPPAKQESAE